MERLALPFKLRWEDRYFLRKFPRMVAGSDKALAQRIREQAATIVQEEIPRIVDQQSQGHALMCALVLAAYRELQPARSEPELLEFLAKMFCKAAGGKYVQWGSRLMLWFQRDARRFVRFFSGDRTQRAYGKWFRIVEEETDTQFRVLVQRCGFYEFFRRHQEPQLTRILCEWDYLWADEINRVDRGVIFKRPRTIAQGADYCAFEFHFTRSTSGTGRAEQDSENPG